MENPHNTNLDHLELGYRAMMMMETSVSSNPSPQSPLAISGKTFPYLKSPPQRPQRQPQQRPAVKPEAHIGGVNIQKFSGWLKWRFIVITMSVFLIELILGAWPIIALSVWGWTSIYVIGHFLWWIKAGLLLPAVIRNMGTSYDLASDSVKYSGQINPSGASLYKVFWNSAYTWDLTLWSMTSVLGHTTISLLLIILTIFTRHVIPSRLQWFLLLLFDVIAIIESIASPWFVMDRAINRPTLQAREDILKQGGRWDSDDDDTNNDNNTDDDYYYTRKQPKIIKAAFIQNPWPSASRTAKNNNSSIRSSDLPSLLGPAHIQGKIYRGGGKKKTAVKKQHRKKKKKSRRY